MQRPVGFVINEGRAEMTDLGALLTNGRLLWEFPHTVAAGFATGAFLVAGISAWKLLKKKQVDFFRTSFKLSIVTAVIASIAIALFGHGQAQYMAETQPMKMAAAEGLWETSSDPAPFTLFALIDAVTQENKFEVKVPYMLSILTHNKLTGSIPGMNDIQAAYEEQFGEGNYIPPVRTTFWSFRIMVGSGVLMILLALYGTFMALRNKWASLGNKFFYMMVAAIGLPFIGNTAGWIMTEVGRQPWTVFGLFKTEDSVSPSVSAGEVLFSLIGFSFMYLILLGVLVYLFARTARKGPVIVTDDSPVDETEEEY